MKANESKLHKFLRRNGAVRKFKAELTASSSNFSYDEWCEGSDNNPNGIWGAFIFHWTNNGEDFNRWVELASKYELMIRKEGAEQ